MCCRPNLVRVQVAAKVVSGGGRWTWKNGVVVVKIDEADADVCR